MHTELGDEVEFHEESLPLAVHEGVRIDTEALHHAEGTGNASVRHSPQNHMRG